MGGPNSTRWGNHQKKTLVEDCLALDASDLRRLGILSSPDAVAGRFDWKDGASGTVLGSASFWLGAIEADDTRELRLRLSEELDPSGHLQVFKLERVTVGCAPRWLLRCPQCGVKRARRLFLPPKRQRLACKACWHLQYKSVAEHDARVDKLVGAIRRGDDALVQRHLGVGERGGYRGFANDKLVLAAFAKVFPALTDSTS